MNVKPTILIPVLLLISLVLGGYLWHLGDLRAHGPTASQSQQAQAPIGGPFSLTDQNGARRTDKDYRGKFMLVFFGYTYCPDVCPTTLAVISAALDRLGPQADDLVPIFISVDPKRDKPEVLKSYLAAFGTRFAGLTGTDKEVDVAAKAYRVFYQAHAAEGGAYTLDHSSVIYLMDKNGAFVANYTLETSPDAMAKDIKQKLAGQS